MIATGEVAGFEALVRWRHPRNGLVPPSEFIPLAEETGLIVPLGMQVLEAACRQVHTWNLARPERPFSLHVNLSPKQLLAGNLIQAVGQALAESGLPSRLLNLEITETVIIENPVAAQNVLGRLKELGAGLSLDDFGTGYSSLSSFFRFPVDALKIDRSFISRLGSDTKCTEIVKAIIGLTRRLGKMVVAEGVETAEQAGWLRKWGCGLAQGYLFYRPLDPEAANRLVQDLAEGRAQARAEQLEQAG